MMCIIIILCYISFDVRVHRVFSLCLYTVSVTHRQCRKRSHRSESFSGFFIGGEGGYENLFKGEPWEQPPRSFFKFKNNIHAII